jgi:hypothetical protein
MWRLAVPVKYCEKHVSAGIVQDRGRSSIVSFDIENILSVDTLYGKDVDTITSPTSPSNRRAYYQPIVDLSLQHSEKAYQNLLVTKFNF